MKNKKIVARVLAGVLAAVLLLGLLLPAVSAADAAQIAFGQVDGKCGQQVTVPVTITNNPGIASFRFRVAYDPAALTFVSAEKGELMTRGTLNAAYQETAQELAVTWFDVKNLTGDGVLFNLVFAVSETADGTYPLTVSYLPEDMVNASWQQIDCGVIAGSVRAGYQISGAVSAPGAIDGTATIRLLQDGQLVREQISADGKYSLAGVSRGSYQLQFTVAGYLEQTVEITVADADIICDARMRMVADFDNDSRINNADVLALLWHSLFPDLNPVDIPADLTGDELVTNDDVIRLLWHTLFPDEFPL